MALISKDKLISAYVGWNTVFNDALTKAAANWKVVAMETRSDNPVEEYKWLNQVPQMRKWAGDRVIEKLSAEGIKITSYDWANGVEVERDDLRDDKLGMVEKRVRACATAGVDAINREVFTTLNNGFTALGGKTYDGQFLIDTDHTASTEGGQASQSNHGTAVLSETSLPAAIQQMMGIKDDKGQFLNIFPTKLLTGIALWATARRLLVADEATDGSTNLNKGIVEHVVSPYITGNKWFLVDDRSGLLPIIVQMRQDAEFRAPVDDMNTFAAFIRKTLYFGADMTFGIGLGLWQTIYGSDGTVG